MLTKCSLVAAVLWISCLARQDSSAFSIQHRPRATLNSSHASASANTDHDADDTTTTPPSLLSSRREWAKNTAASIIATTGGLILPTNNANASDDDLIDVYFGCGCFWHVQHEFVEAERRILNRSDADLTARAGYAGGKAGALDGKVCYHNFNRVSDYGPLGHAEIVSLRIPASSYKDFAAEYVKLFDKNGFRPDQAGDRGSEYRNLVGFPGAAKSDLYLKQLVEASKENGDKLAFAEGLGDDPDRRALVFVMDSDAFAPFVAEQYHQFHDGFAMGEGYPQTYNDIAFRLAKAGTLGKSDCPNGMI
mmetsp:Transcript_39345/g.94677  ORF Transcript_39345/g.94677 Transcript_39345/m.94677 type:complete len:306 (-) Transcript_39345:242-1159(-)